MADKFDVIITGAGPGGYVAAIRAAQPRLKTVCVEKWVNKEGKTIHGGADLNVGCIPSKALLETSYKFVETRDHYPEVGINVGDVATDVKQMMAFKNSVIAKNTGGISMLFKSNDVTALKVTGKLLDGKQVEVTGHDGKSQAYAADNVIIASGSVPVNIPSVPVTDDIIVDSTGALEFSEAPKRLGMIGAGVIGLELGSVSRLGSEVTVLEALSTASCRWSTRRSPRRRLKLLKKQDLDIKVGAHVTGSKVKGDSREVAAHDSDGDQEQTFDKPIVCVGRKPYTNKLLDERGFIFVDDQCRTSVSGVYAIGDVMRGKMLAHKASEESVMVADIIAGQKPEMNYDTIPSVIYTTPEVAWVGRATGKEQGIARPAPARQPLPFSASDRVLANNAPEGMVKGVTDGRHRRQDRPHPRRAHPWSARRRTDRPRRHRHGVRCQRRGSTCFAHPTLSEAVHEAVQAVDMANRKKRK